MFQSIIGFRFQSRFASVILIGLVAKELSSSPLGAHKDVNIEPGEITGHVPKGAPLSLKSTNVVVSSSLTGLPAKESAPQTAGHPGAQSSQEVDDSDDDDEPVGELGVHPSMARTKSAPSSAGGRSPGETFQNQPKDTVTEIVKSSQQPQQNGLATTVNNNPAPAQTFATEDQSLPDQTRSILPQQQPPSQNNLDSNSRNEGQNIFLGTRQPLKLPAYTAQARPEFHNDAKDDINDPLKVDPSDNEVNRFPGSDVDGQPTAQTLSETTKASSVKPGKTVAKISVAASSAKPKLALPSRASTTSKPSEAITSSDKPDIVAAWPEVLVPLSSRGTVQNPVEALGENLPEIPPAVQRSENSVKSNNSSTGETFGFPSKTQQGSFVGGPPSISPTAEFSGNAVPQQIFPLGTDDTEISGGRLSEQDFRTATNNFAPNSLTETSLSPKQASTHSSLKLALKAKPTTASPQISASASKQPEVPRIIKTMKHSVRTTRGRPVIAFETDETSFEEDDDDEITPRANQGDVRSAVNVSSSGGLTLPGRPQSNKPTNSASQKSDVQVTGKTNRPEQDNGVEATLIAFDEIKPNNASVVPNPSLAPLRIKPLQLPQQNVSTPPQVKNESLSSHQNSSDTVKQTATRSSKPGSWKPNAASLPTDLPIKDSSSVGVAQFAVTIPSELPTTTNSGIPVSVRIAKQKGSRKSTTVSPPISRNVSKEFEAILPTQSGPTSEESWMPNFARSRNNSTAGGSNKTERKQVSIGQEFNANSETFHPTTPIFPEIEQEFSADEASSDISTANSSITSNSIFAPQPALLQPIVNQLNNFTAPEFGRLIPHFVEKQKQNYSAGNPKVETFGKIENSKDIDSNGEQFEISQNSQVIIPVLSVGAAIQPPPNLVSQPNSQQRLRNITQLANFGIPESPKPIIPGEMVPVIPVIQQDLPKPGPFLSNSNTSANETFRNLANLLHPRVDNGLSQAITNSRKEDIGIQTFSTPKSRQGNAARTPTLPVPSEKPTSAVVLAGELTSTQRQAKATKVHKTTTQDPRILLPIGIGSDSMFDDDGQGYKDKEEDNNMR